MHWNEILAVCQYRRQRFGTLIDKRLLPLAFALSSLRLGNSLPAIKSAEKSYRRETKAVQFLFDSRNHFQMKLSVCVCVCVLVLKVMNTAKQCIDFAVAFL